MSNAAEAFANAKGERFAVSLLGEDGAPTECVTVQVRVALDSEVYEQRTTRE